MNHIDEGTLEAWLDEQLPADEAARVASHVASCEGCAAAVAEARGYIAASKRILGTLDQPLPDTAPLAFTARRPARRVSPWWLRSAAAVMVVALGSYAVLSRSGDGVSTAAAPTAVVVAAQDQAAKSTSIATDSTATVSAVQELASRSRPAAPRAGVVASPTPSSAGAGVAAQGEPSAANATTQVAAAPAAPTMTSADVSAPAASPAPPPAASIAAAKPELAARADESRAADVRLERAKAAVARAADESRRMVAGGTARAAFAEPEQRIAGCARVQIGADSVVTLDYRRGTSPASVSIRLGSAASDTIVQWRAIGADSLLFDLSSSALRAQFHVPRTGNSAEVVRGSSRVVVPLTTRCP